MALALVAWVSAAQVLTTRTNRVEWDSVPGAVEYLVAVSTNKSAVATNSPSIQSNAVVKFTLTTLPTAPVTNLVQNGLVDGTYSVWVRSESAAGLLSLWSTNMIINLATQPEPPVNLRIR